ncbi:MAG: cytochrome P450 [Actinomycetota bacterium]|nr:cytochrome P450 [Actinomycetota bacterium]
MPAAKVGVWFGAAGRRRAIRWLRRRSVALLNNAAFLRRVFAVLRRVAPVLVVGKAVIVTRHDDVAAVLDRDEDFTIAELNASVMDRVNGPFILGMDRSEQYSREDAILERCVRPGDLDRVRGIVRRSVAELVETARPTGRIDVVNGLARVTAVRVVASYLGVAGPDEATMMRWMRTIFHETFLNVTRDRAVRRAGEQSGREFHAYLHALLEQRQAQVRDGDGEAPDDFFTRLVRLQSDDDPATRLSDEGILRNIGGVVVGAVDTTSMATAHVVDELLRRPDALAAARAAAGDSSAMVPVVLEALRFHPINPVLARWTGRDTVIGEGTHRQRRIRQGRAVYASIMSAMFDPAVFEQPGTFRVDRPVSSYLHFGHGLHTCFGERVNVVQMPETVGSLLALDNLRRAPGRDGRIVYDGPFPDRLLVDFDPAVG